MVRWWMLHVIYTMTVVTAAMCVIYTIHNTAALCDGCLQQCAQICVCVCLCVIYAIDVVNIAILCG